LKGLTHLSDYDAFANDDGVNDNANAQKPLFTVDQSDEKALLNWCTAELSFMQQRSLERLMEMRQNISRYEGLYYVEPDQRQGRDRGNYVRINPFARRYQKFIVNHLRDVTEARVSRLTKYKPSIAVVPNTNEYEDKVDARVAKKLIDWLWYQNEIESLRTKAIRIAEVTGEAYLFTLWNPKMGPLSKLAQMNEGGVAEIPVLDDVGNPELDAEGQPITFKGELRVGDIEYRLYPPMQVLLDPKERVEDCDWVITVDRVSVDELRAEYPNKADKIKEEDVDVYSDMDRQRQNQIKHQCFKYTLYHRPTPYLPKGKEIVFTESALLKAIDYQYWDAEKQELPGVLPFVRYVCDEAPNKLHGISIYRSLKPLQDHINTLYTMIVRGQILAAHPKWMMPKGACKLESLGNDITIAQYTGPIAPQLVTFNPTSPELFSFAQTVKQDLQQLSGVFGNSRGEPPAGIKSGVALQFLAEQENERFNLSVQRLQNNDRQLAYLTLLIASLKYEDSDERIIQSVGMGTGLDEQVINFQVDQLRKDFDIRLQNSSSLPESKAARIQTILDLAQNFPDQVPAEQVLEMIGMAAGDKFIDQSTIAVSSAESENEIIMSDGVQVEPEKWENHIQHWKVHYRVLQEGRFKRLPQELQDLFKDHVGAHEMFMVGAALQTPGYAEGLAPLTKLGFPLFFQKAGPGAPPPPPALGPDGLPLPVDQVNPAGPDLQGAAIPPGAELSQAPESIPPDATQPPVAPIG
jgi:hypothetical protein